LLRREGFAIAVLAIFARLRHYNSPLNARRKSAAGSWLMLSN
jgi:hypothetical protein